ncbi:MAG: hypothetical protein KDD94_05115 [Calditrichaeota bacterium]|nr:hypothetical protein [Calditrichota bacterium]
MIKPVLFVVGGIIVGALSLHFYYISQLDDLSNDAERHRQEAEKYYVMFLRDSARLEDSFKQIEKHRQEARDHYEEVLRIRQTILDSLSSSELADIYRGRSHESFNLYLDSILAGQQPGQ